MRHLTRLSVIVAGAIAGAVTLLPTSAANAAAGATYYAAPAAAGAADCSSPADPCDLQTAIDAASSGTDTIVLADGEYDSTGYTLPNSVTLVAAAGASPTLHDVNRIGDTALGLVGDAQLAVSDVTFEFWATAISATGSGSDVTADHVEFSIDGTGVDSAGNASVDSSDFQNNDTALHSTGTLTVTRSTFDASSIDVNSSGTVSVSNSTLHHESIGMYVAGKASASASIIAAAWDFGPSTDCSGPVEDDGFNVTDDGSCPLGFTSVSDPVIDKYLGPLTDNGGPTRTVALLPSPSSPTGSPDPARAAIPITFAAPGLVATVCSVPDQRGVERVLAGCDIGAYELTVATTLVTVTAQRTYGKSPTFAVSGVAGPSAKSLTGTLTGCSTSAPDTVGRYDGDISGCGGLSGLGPIEYVSGTTTVEPARLVVTAPSPTIGYGDTAPTSDALPPSYSGLLVSDSGSKTATCATNATGQPSAGTYQVTCSGVTDPNYDVSYVAGTLTVARAPLTVVGRSVTVAFGDDIPDVSDPTYVGLVNGDSAPSTPATCSADVAGGAVGAYPVTCSGAADDNYRIAYLPGSVTITDAPVTVVAPTLTIQYGDPLPELTPSYVGDSGEPANPATCAYDGDITPHDVGRYLISCSGSSDDNLRIAYQPGSLTILRAPLVVSAPSPTIIYGHARPVMSPTYSGFVGTDTAASLTTPAVCASVAAAVPSRGHYPVTCAGASAANYNIRTASGTLSVLRHPLVVTPRVTTESYAHYQAHPTLAPRYRGFVRGETASVLISQSVCTPGRQITKPGNYTVICRGARSANYSMIKLATPLVIT
jgi:hypothetical protein